MIIIHMRKSGGTSLIHTLSKSLSIPIVNCPDLNDRSNLSMIAESKACICSIHLHPTKENFEMVKSFNFPYIVLLRNPPDAYEALKDIQLKMAKVLDQMELCILKIQNLYLRTLRQIG